jgi:hypothetical protein
MIEPILPSPAEPGPSRNLIPILVFPLISCVLSSVIGLILGQIGNQIYRVYGDLAGCLTVPAFLGLFAITFGLSFFGNRLARKFLSDKLGSGASQ